MPQKPEMISMFSNFMLVGFKLFYLDNWFDNLRFYYLYRFYTNGHRYRNRFYLFAGFRNFLYQINLFLIGIVFQHFFIIRFIIWNTVIKKSYHILVYTETGIW